MTLPYPTNHFIARKNIGKNTRAAVVVRMNIVEVYRTNHGTGS